MVTRKQLFLGLLNKGKKICLLLSEEADANLLSTMICEHPDIVLNIIKTKNLPSLKCQKCRRNIGNRSYKIGQTYRSNIPRKKYVK